MAFVFFLAGDEVSAPVRWKGSSDIAAYAGQTISLRFRLRTAKLFGFAFV